MTKNNSKLITGWDEYKTEKVKLVIKQDDKTVMKTLKNEHWYFAIQQKDYERIGGKQFFIKFNKTCKIKHIYNICSKNNFNLIYCRYTIKNTFTQQLIAKLKELHVEAFEADLSRTKRYLVDKLAPIAENLSILYFDIETDDSNAGIKIGRDRIISWAAYNDKGQKWFLCLDNEKKLLEELLKLIDAHDIFTGWNSAKFDLPYIQARMLKYKIYYQWRKKIHIDMMQRCIKVYSYNMDKIGLTGFSLNEFARVFLKTKKVEFKGGTMDLFQNDRETLKKYNLQDVKILYDLDKKLSIMKLMIKSCVLTGATLDRFYVGELLDTFMLRRAKELNTHLHSRPSQEEAAKNKEMHIIGGYVMNPIRGFYNNIRVLDFKSLYPSIMISWNISANSLDKEKSKFGDVAFLKFVQPYKKIENVDFQIWHNFLKEQKKILDPNNECMQTANNNFFRKDVTGFISRLIKELLDSRAEFKKMLISLSPDTLEYNNALSSQSMIKELANSMYGIHADRNSRYFNKNIAESITITGQYLNKAVAAISNKLGFLVIYSDTDSIFCVISDKDNPTKINNIINTTLITCITKCFQLEKCIVQLEYEKAYRKMIMVDKKRYSGVLNQIDGKNVEILYSKGLEDVKKNTINIAKLKMRELILMLTRDDKDLKYIIEWLEKLKQYVFNSKKIVKEDICITTRLSKPTYKYKSKSVHVFLAEELIKKHKLMQPSESKDSWGTRLTYIISSTTPSLKATHIDDFDGTWDKIYYWDIQIYAPIMRILKTVWPDENWAQYSIAETIRLQKVKEREEQKKERERLNIVREQEQAKRKLEREKIKKQKEKEHLQKKKEREKNQKARKQEQQKLQKLREQKKKERDALRRQREKERLQHKQKREKLRQQRNKERMRQQQEKEKKKNLKNKQLKLL